MNGSHISVHLIKLFLQYVQEALTAPFDTSLALQQEDVATAMFNTYASLAVAVRACSYDLKKITLNDKISIRQ